MANFKKFKIVMISLVLSSCAKMDSQTKDFIEVSRPDSTPVYPMEDWKYTSPENFGYSLEQLEDVRSYFQKIGGDALMVIKSGYVIIAWGEVAKPIPNFSIRKSFLNSLYGMGYDSGNISLDVTLAELGIDDVQSLTDTEKSATILNLMTSSSGVYHPGAYESKEQKGARPPRGSFNPGTFFYYNNWDFNTLGSIYNKLSSKDLFASFKENISDNIHMQDFNLSHTSYVYDNESKFPAYNFKSSARDDARFGYLYLRKGRWEDQQLISEDWVDMSFKMHIKTADYYYYDYGLLWWIDTTNQQYIARGNSGQYIAVLPKEDMVIVFRADPGSVVNKWLGMRVKPQESFLLIPKILSTKAE